MAQSDAEIMKLVLEAEDRLTPELTKLQQRVASLTWSFSNLSQASKIDFRELTWSDRELALLNNKIIDTTNQLQNLTKGTDEYNIVLHSLMSSVDSYNEKMQAIEDRATEEVKQALLRQQAVANYNYEQKLATQTIQQQEVEMQKYIQQTSNVAQSVEYWKKRVDDIKVAISDQTAKLKDAEQTYWKTSKEATLQRAELERLEKEYKTLNRTLKDAKQNQWFFADSLDIVRDKIKQNLALTIGKSLVSFAVEWIKEMWRNIIKYWTQMNAVSLQFEQMASRWGMAYTELRNSLRTASKWMVDDISIMQSANKAMSLWVGQDIESMAQLMKIAQVRGAQMWETTAKAFDDIVTWIGRQSAMILDNLWIVINSKDAYERYATSIGKTTDELTKQEKQQAITNEVIRQSWEELKARENLPLTVAQKIEILKTSSINSFAAIGDAFFKRTEPILDEIIKISNQVTDSLTQTTDDFNQSTWNIRVAVSGVLNNIRENFEWVYNSVKEILESVVNIFWTVTTTIWWIIGELLFWIDKDSSTCAYSFRDHFMLAINMIGQGFEVLGKAASQFFRALNQWTENIGNWSKAIWWWLKGVWNAMMEWKSDLIAEFQRWFWTAEVVETEIITWKDAIAERETLWGKFITQVEDLWKDLVEADRYTGSKLWDWWKSVFGWNDDTTKWWGWSWSKKSWKSEAEKDMENRVKQMKKNLEDLQKFDKENFKSLDELGKNRLKVLWENVTDLVKEYEKSFDALQKKIDETKKNIEKLEQDIENLHNKMAELTADRDKSLAEEFLSAQDTIEELKRNFEWIEEVANSISRDELNNLYKWDYVWWFDVENVKKMKTSLEEVSWLYDWLNDEEIEALQEQIKYQERYNSLNKIQKIKEDYRIKREEIQKELDAKMVALETEKIKQDELKKEQEIMQQEYKQRIQDALEEYENMYQTVLNYETDYMKKREDNNNTRIKKLDDLRRAYEEVAEAAREAASYGGWWTTIEWYANGWNVQWNVPILVWERWPELFVPRSNWTIIKNEDLNTWWKPTTINITFWDVVLNNWMDEEQFAEFLISTIKNINLWYI